MVLESAMLLVATTCQTVFHPHYSFQGSWHDANFSMGKNKMKRQRESDGFELMGKSNTSSASIGPMMH